MKYIKAILKHTELSDTAHRVAFVIRAKIKKHIIPPLAPLILGGE
jgi:hypothetical protein